MIINLQASAISAEVANLFNGIVFKYASLVAVGKARVMSVSTNPGKIALTRMFFEASSMADALVKPTRPAFEAEYAVLPTVI